MNERYIKDFDTKGIPLHEVATFDAAAKTGDWKYYDEACKKTPSMTDIFEASRLMFDNGITDFNKQARILVYGLDSIAPF